MPAGNRTKPMCAESIQGFAEQTDAEMAEVALGIVAGAALDDVASKQIAPPSLLREWSRGLPIAIAGGTRPSGFDCDPWSNVQRQARLVDVSGMAPLSWASFRFCEMILSREEHTSSAFSGPGHERTAANCWITSFNSRLSRTLKAASEETNSELDGDFFRHALEAMSPSCKAHDKLRRATASLQGGFVGGMGVMRGS